jgi:hypothetical protein
MKVGQMKKIREVGEAEAMSGVDLDFRLMGFLRRFPQLGQGGGAVSRIRIGKTAGVKFDNGSFDSHGRFDLPEFGVEKETHENSGLFQFLNDRAERIEVAGGIQSTFRGDFSPIFRDETDLRRFEAERKIDHGGGGGHFEVKFFPEFATQP